jgi:hypothetical protein
MLHSSETDRWSRLGARQGTGNQQQDQAPEEALKRARAAFSGKADEQIMDEGAQVIDPARTASRPCALTSRA